MVFNAMLFTTGPDANINSEPEQRNENQTQNFGRVAEKINVLKIQKSTTETNQIGLDECDTISSGQDLLSTNQAAAPLSNYYNLRIPKSPSFHSGLALLAGNGDRTDGDKQQTNGIDCRTASIVTNRGLGCKFNFANIEELKAKFSHSSSAPSTVKKLYKKMPSLQPQESGQNFTTSSSLSSSFIPSTNSSSNSSTTSQSISSLTAANTSSLFSPTNISSMAVSYTSGDVTNVAHQAAMILNAATATSCGGGSALSTAAAAVTNSISATTSSIVSTLAQHFNAATSATSLLNTASSTLGATNKSPVSAAAAIKNILNATKSVGNSINATQHNNDNSDQVQGLTTTPIVTAMSTAANNITTSSVTQSIVSGVSISLGLGNSSNNTNRNIASTATLSNNQKRLITGQCQNGDEGNFLGGGGGDRANLNSTSDDKTPSIVGSESLMTQTLQQITGSPGRARDRNIFHSPSSSSAAAQLPLLRGFIMHTKTYI
uniref:Uncharacterized protein n=1 Tax=Glossina brevipalpis TaxID=37001 RepID=A0A1A9WJK8_9MUSC